MKKFFLPAMTLAALTPGLAQAHPGHEHTSNVLSHSLAITLIALACVGIAAAVAVLRSRARAGGRAANELRSR